MGRVLRTSEDDEEQGERAGRLWFQKFCGDLRTSHGKGARDHAWVREEVQR